jgi:hypothetical protein
MLWVAVVLFLAITSKPIAADGGAAVNHLENSRSDSHTWEYSRNLRGLEDAGNYQEQDYDQENGDDANNDGTFMTIEHEVETALKDMFYSAPSEWTPLHWAFFTGLVLIASILLCWFCICFITCCCCPRRGSDAKQLVVRTEEEHNRYTNDLMVNDNHTDDDHESDGNDSDDDSEEHNHYTDDLMVNDNRTDDEHESDGNDSDDDDSAEGSSEHETVYTESISNLDSSPSTFEESFQDEYQESDTDAYEFTSSHGDYYKYTGRNRRQLT